MMIELLAFGSLELRDAHGRLLQVVMAQPKRAALLAYLALARLGCTAGITSWVCFGPTWTTRTHAAR